MGEEADNKEPTFRTRWFKFCEESSCHGLCHIRKTKPFFVNATWFLWFAVASAAALNGIGQVLMLYLNRPMTTDYRIVGNKTLELPSMSICAFSYISKTRMRDLGISQSLQNALYYSLGFMYHEEDARNKTTDLELQRLLARLHLDDVEDLLLRLSIPCEEMFSECSMGAHEFDCCRDMRQFLFPAKCITIAAKGFLPASEAWQYTVVLNWPSAGEELMASMISARSREYSIMINRGNRAMVGAKAIGYASPGYMYTVNVVTRIYESVNNPPAYECLEKPDEDYDTESCMERCTISAHFNRSGASECPCVSGGTFEGRPIKRDANTSDPDYKPICSPLQLLECKEAMMKRHQEAHYRVKREESEEDNAYERCQKECPRTCRKVAYSATVLPTQQDPDLIEDYLLHQGFTEQQRQRARNSSFLVLKYNDMEYKHTIQQLAMTWETVMSYLGGQLGLFLGGSVLTFVHCFTFVFHEFCRWGQTQQRERRRSSAVPVSASITANGRHPVEEESAPVSDPVFVSDPVSVSDPVFVSEPLPAKETEPLAPKDTLCRYPDTHSHPAVSEL